MNSSFPPMATTRFEILHAQVVRDRIVLTQYSPHLGTFGVITQRLLPLLDTTTRLAVYEYDGHPLYILASSTSPSAPSLLFLCFTTSKVPPRIAFAFLEDVRARFLAQYEDSLDGTILPLEVNQAFSGFLSDAVAKFSHFHRHPDVLLKLRGQPEELKTRHFAVKDLTTHVPYRNRPSLLWWSTVSPEHAPKREEVTREIKRMDTSPSWFRRHERATVILTSISLVLVGVYAFLVVPFRGWFPFENRP